MSAAEPDANRRRGDPQEFQMTATSSPGWANQGKTLDAIGYGELVPIQPGSKRPSAPDWNNTDFNAKGFGRIYKGHGVGVKGGETPGVDLDIADENVCRKTVDWCHRNIGPAPLRIGRPPRALLVYRSAEPLRKSRSNAYRSPDGQIHRIDLIGRGGQFVAYGIHPGTGKPYEWLKGELTDTPAADLCEITQDQVYELFRYFDEIAVATGWTRVEPAKQVEAQKPRQPAGELTAPIHELEAAISVILVQPESYDRWTKIGMALHHATEGSDEGFALWDAWSSRGDKYDPDEMDAKWQSFGRASPGAVLGAKTIFAEADKADPDWRDRVHRPSPVTVELSAKLRSLSEKVGTAAIMAEDDDIAGDDGAPSEALNVVSIASFEGQEIPERQWVVTDLIPACNVTDLAGDGGVGKSLLALQLAVAVATGRPWLGRTVEQGSVLYFSCEDSVDEIRRRLVPITRAGVLQLSDLANLQIADRTAADRTELADVVAGKLTMTEVYRLLIAYVLKERPKLVIIDTRADVFGGNEIDRVQVRTFVRQLRKLCLQHDLAVLLLSHPSVTGINTGTGQSGSTGWGNSVRSRLYLERAKSTDGGFPDPDLRTLSSKKNNYGPSDAEIMLRWRGGLFQTDGLLSQEAVDHAAQDQLIEQEFLTRLDEFTKAGQRVSASKSPSYAPTLFARRIEAENRAGKIGKVGIVSSKLLAAAMERLFVKERLRVEDVGPPSRRYSMLVRA